MLSVSQLKHPPTIMWVVVSSSGLFGMIGKSVTFWGAPPLPLPWSKASWWRQCQCYLSCHVSCCWCWCIKVCSGDKGPWCSLCFWVLLYNDKHAGTPEPWVIFLRTPDACMSCPCVSSMHPMRACYLILISWGHGNWWMGSSTVVLWVLEFFTMFIFEFLASGKLGV